MCFLHAAAIFNLAPFLNRKRALFSASHIHKLLGADLLVLLDHTDRRPFSFSEERMIIELKDESM